MVVLKTDVFCFALLLRCSTCTTCAMGCYTTGRNEFGWLVPQADRFQLRSGKWNA